MQCEYIKVKSGFAESVPQIFCNLAANHRTGKATKPGSNEPENISDQPSATIDHLDQGKSNIQVVALATKYYIGILDAIVWCQNLCCVMFPYSTSLFHSSTWPK